MDHWRALQEGAEGVVGEGEQLGVGRVVGEGKVEEGARPQELEVVGEDHVAQGSGEGVAMLDVVVLHGEDYWHDCAGVEAEDHYLQEDLSYHLVVEVVGAKYLLWHSCYDLESECPLLTE